MGCEAGIGIATGGSVFGSGVRGVGSDSTAVAEAMRRVRAALGLLQDKDEATRVSRMKHWGVRGMEGSSEEIRFNGSGRSNAACESGFGAAALGG